MDIQATSAAFVQSQTQAAEADNNATSQAISSDFETFLTLLTAQMRNQDPLNPVESTEFVSQLASFSSVEQQVRSNDTLDSILAALSGDSLSGLSQWIDREVRADASAAFEGRPITVYTDPAPGAERATLLVTNDFGDTVARQPVSPTEASVIWTGALDTGAVAANGNYRFSLLYTDAEGAQAQRAGEVFVPVSEVQLDNGSATLLLRDGTVVPVDQIEAVRAAA